MERNIYLNLTDPLQAKKIWFEKIEKDYIPPGQENVPLTKCANRIIAEAVFAKRSSPAFHGAAMDGYAVKAEDTFTAIPTRPLQLELGKSAWPVNTGQALPPHTNAVIMVEDINLDQSGNFIVIEKAAFPWQHVRKTGEDIVETEVILPPGTHIGAPEIGALAAGGVLAPPVCKLPKVCIIPSGSDLVPLEKAEEEKLKAGVELPEFNSLIFSAMLQAIAAEPEIMPITPDNPEALMDALIAAEKHKADLIIINAGTSAGTHDYSSHVLSSCGEVLVHGVKLMPGKPVILGIANLNGRKVPVAGIPGYPVSAFVAMEEFILPLIAHWQKREMPQRQTMVAFPFNPLPSRPGMEERIRVKLGIVDGKAWAVPLPRGAGTVTSLSRADAFITVPPDSEGLNGGEGVPASLLRSPKEIAGALLAIGSHDNTLDIIDSLLRRKHPRFRLTSAHVGSLGGLLAVARGQAHFAGTHLLDPATGVYNREAITRHLGKIPVTLIRLVNREQGIILPKGNPLKINSLYDIAAKNIRFINRQKGSGTRVLLDYQLSQAGIQAQNINGYRNEEYTHMNIAQAVLSGRADAGLGVRAAANALDLDFIPIGYEEYDLAIPLKYMEDERLLALLEVIRSGEFKEIVEKMGGYSTAKTGEVIWQNEI